MMAHASMVDRTTSSVRPMVLATLTGVGVAAWTLAIFVIPSVQFVVFTPRGKSGFDVSVALLSLFVALVLLLFPDERGGAS